MFEVYAVLSFGSNIHPYTTSKWFKTLRQVLVRVSEAAYVGARIRVEGPLTLKKNLELAKKVPAP
jgi:hypothetical protein